MNEMFKSLEFGLYAFVHVYIPVIVSLLLISVAFVPLFTVSLLGVFGLLTVVPMAVAVAAILFWLDTYFEGVL